MKVKENGKRENGSKERRNREKKGNYKGRERLGKVMSKYENKER